VVLPGGAEIREQRPRPWPAGWLPGVGEWGLAFGGRSVISTGLSLAVPDSGAALLSGGLAKAWPPDPEPLRRTGCGKGSERDLTEIKLKKGEPVDRALRRLKKRVDREGTLKEVRNHRHFEKPSERRRRKMKVARFNAMLAARYADV
jgi:small subunit ribosomal protein S21